MIAGWDSILPAARFDGGTLGEVTQAIRMSVKCQGAPGHWFIHLHAEGEGRTLKAATSKSKVQIHLALIDGYLLRHVASSV
jgi:hypothetical protein